MRRIKQLKGIMAFAVLLSSGTVSAKDVHVWEKVEITLEDIVSAMIGSLLLLIIIWFIGRKRG